MTKYKSNDNIRGHVFSEPHICIVRHSHRHIAHNIFFYLRVQVKTERCTTPPPPRPPILFSAPTTSPAVGPPYRVSKNTPYIALHTLPPLHNYCTTLTQLRLLRQFSSRLRNVATSSDFLGGGIPWTPELRRCSRVPAARNYSRQNWNSTVGPPSCCHFHTVGTTTFLDSILMCKHFIRVNKTLKIFFFSKF